MMEDGPDKNSTLVRSYADYTLERTLDFDLLEDLNLPSDYAEVQERMRIVQQSGAQPLPTLN